VDDRQRAERLSLPTADMPTGPASASSTLPKTIDNVVPLHRVPRIDDRRH
jgi:hypothetical protein